MTGRNPRYATRHPAKPTHKPAAHPSQRVYPVLEQPAPLTYAARIASYSAANAARGSHRLTPAQQRRLDRKAHRYGTREKRAAQAAERRAAAIAAAQQDRDNVLLGRVVQLPVARWATSAKAMLRSGHRG